MVAGAGPSTGLVQLFFDHFSRTPPAQGFHFTVPPRSVKHAGGLRAAETQLFGRTGRPLTPDERASGKREIILGRVPLSFVRGRGVTLSTLRLDQLEAVFRRQARDWEELGGAPGAIFLLGREPTEAALGVLRIRFAFLDEARFDQLLLRDHQVVNFIHSEAGRFALGFGARSNFEPEDYLTVENIALGVALGLVYDLKNRDHPLVRAAAAFAGTPYWLGVVTRSEFLPRE